MSLNSSTQVETNRWQLEISVDANTFNTAVDHAYKKQKNRIVIPGFRKGKAPRAFIEKYYGPDIFYEDAINEVYPDALEEAVKESKLDMIQDKVDFDLVSADKENGLVFKATITVKPEISIQNYTGIPATRKSTEVTDEDVAAELARVQDRNSRMVTVEDRPAENGDVTDIDFEGFLDGEPFEGGKSENFSLRLGSNQFIPGFEDQIVGHNTGDEFDVNVTFPDDYQAEDLRGQSVLFKVKLHEIKKKELPALDDEFAKDVSDTCETLEDLKKEITERLKKERQENVEHAFEEKILDAVIEGMKADIPQAMVESQIDSFVQDFGYRLQMQGMTLEQYIKMTGTEMGAFRAMFRDQADRQVKTRLALEKVAELENIAVSDKELDEEYAKMAEQYKMDVEKVKSIVAADALAADLKVSEALELVKKNAKAIKPAVKKKAEDEAAEETAE